MLLIPMVEFRTLVHVPCDIAKVKASLNVIQNYSFCLKLLKLLCSIHLSVFWVQLCNQKYCPKWYNIKSRGRNFLNHLHCQRGYLFFCAPWVAIKRPLPYFPQPKSSAERQNIRMSSLKCPDANTKQNKELKQNSIR